MTAHPSVAQSAARAPLLERSVELATIAAALDEAERGNGSMIVIEGEGGIGKSSLIAQATQEAAARAMAVLSARGSELEQIHAFGVATTLFTPVAAGGDAARELMRGSAAPAHILLAPQSGLEPAPGSLDQSALVHALFWLSANVAEQGPVLLAIDDAHWADDASLRFLAYLGERVGGLPVVLLVALRGGEASERPAGEHVRSHRGATRLTLSPLSREAVDDLIRRTSDAAMPAAGREAVWRETGGNPFFVVELLRSVDAPPADAGEAAATRSPAVPDAIHASIRRRLSRGGAVGRRVAEAVAVLGDEADLVRVARLADVSEDEAAVAIRQLTARELLDRQSLAVIHPVVRAAVIEQIPHAVLDRLHLLAARVLAETNGSPSTAAAHLVITSPAGDDATVEVLRAAAESAMAAGDAAGAVRFLTRAVAEPPAPTRLAGILVELARAESAAGDPAASSRFEQAIDHLGSARDRAEARLAQGHALIQATRWADAAAAFEAGLDLVEVDQVELKSRLEAGYIASAFVGIADHAEAKRRLDHILRSPLHDPAQRELAAWSAFQATLTVEGTVDDVVALARRAVKGAELAELAHGSQVIELVAGVLLATGQLDEDVDLLDRALVAAQASNAHAKVGVYSYCRSLPFYLAGRLQDAIADGEMALAVHEHGWETFYPGTCASLAWSHLERGELETAERLVAIDDEVWGQRLDFQFMLQIARGRVASARGDVAEAVAQFERARAAGNAMGVFSTQVLADWRTWSAAALRGLGRQDEAIEVANEALTLAERWQEPIARGRAHWALGIALGGADGIEHLRLARAELDTSVAQLERARAALDLGAALRRSGHLTDARESLVAAADLAHRLGAFAIRDRARSELVAAGARPRRYALTGVDALTPSELRVAQLAAAGRTNREVAQSLFVTPKAVEYHLANAYRKLGIGSREELPRALEPVEQLASV